MDKLAHKTTAICLVLTAIFAALTTHAVTPARLIVADTKSDCRSLLGKGEPATPDLAIKINKAINTLLSQHLKIDTEQSYDVNALNFERPSWGHHSIAIELIKELEASARNYKDGKINLTAEDKSRLQNLIAFYRTSINKSINEYKNDPIKTAYYLRFLDYNIAYFRKLEQINLTLGLDVFPLDELIQLPKDEKLIAQGVTLVANNETYLKGIYSKFGHDSLETFREYLKSLSVEYSKTLDFVENEVVVSLHLPPEVRSLIEHTGFQNQRATGTSEGDYSSDSSLVDLNDVNYRDKSEAALNGIEINKYVNMSAQVKAKYAEAIPHPAHQYIEPNLNAEQYGSDQWLIKKEVYEKRATWTPDDSLGHGRVNDRRDSHDHLFIPWSARALMAPYADKNLNHENKLLPNSPETKIKFITNTWRKVSRRYFEVQIWGPLTINDVSGFMFGEVAPSDEFYKLLSSKNIEVWDARKWPATRYYGIK